MNDFSGWIRSCCGVLLLGLTFSSSLIWGDDKPIGDGIADVPIFDAHIHYKEPAWAHFSVERVMQMLDRSGVAMGLVSSTPDEGTIRLWRHAPNRIIPELRPYRVGANSSNWTSDEGMKEYSEERLSLHPHEGIGEFHIRGRGMWDDALMGDVVKMAKERNIPLHIHSGAEAIRWVYAVDPDVKIIWAHAGLSDSPTTVYALMEEFPDLFADTSLRESEILGDDGGLDNAWRKIIFAFQDRLMVGSDTWVNGQWIRYGEIMDSNRRWLSLLPRGVAEKIAYRNAEKLFGRSISMDQIGTR